MTKQSSLAVVLCLVLLALSLALTGCARKSVAAAGPAPTAFGAAIVESSGGKQIGAAGSVLPQPWVVQVNDEWSSRSKL